MPIVRMAEPGLARKGHGKPELEQANPRMIATRQQRLPEKYSMDFLNLGRRGCESSDAEVLSPILFLPQVVTKLRLSRK